MCFVADQSACNRHSACIAVAHHMRDHFKHHNKRPEAEHTHAKKNLLSNKYQARTSDIYFAQRALQLRTCVFHQVKMCGNEDEDDDGVRWHVLCVNCYSVNRVWRDEVFSRLERRSKRGIRLNCGNLWRPNSNAGYVGKSDEFSHAFCFWRLICKVFYFKLQVFRYFILKILSFIKVWISQVLITKLS